MKTRAGFHGHPRTWVQGLPDASKIEKLLDANDAKRYKRVAANQGPRPSPPADLLLLLFAFP